MVRRLISSAVHGAHMSELMELDFLSKFIELARDSVLK